MRGINKCIFIGNLGANPEKRYTGGGKTVCNFRIAVTDSWSRDGEKQEKVEWVPVVVWGKLAEICDGYLYKGSSVYVEGKWQTRSWEDKNGTKRYSTECVASEVLFLGGRERQDAGTDLSDYDQRPPTISDDDVPF